VRGHSPEDPTSTICTEQIRVYRAVLHLAGEQERLRGKMHELTEGDLNKPVIAAGWNSEPFDGRNLAPRLVAPGYTRAYDAGVR
jgi:hypothetical protein